MVNRVLMLHRVGGEVDVFTKMNPSDFVDALDNDDIQGFFGTYPEMNQIDQVKGKLYILGEEGSLRHLIEKTFYVRFGLSVLIFLVLFYFFSYIVHDPVPLVDEVGLSLGGAFLFSFWHKRRLERGTPMVQKRIDVKGSIDGIEFTESLFLRELELYLETLEQRPLDKILSQWDRESYRPSAEDRTGMAAELLHGVEKHLGRRNLNRFGRLIRKGDIPLRLLEKTVGDVPLALLYFSCRKSLFP